MNGTRWMLNLATQETVMVILNNASHSAVIRLWWNVCVKYSESFSFTPFQQLHFMAAILVFMHSWQIFICSRKGYRLQNSIVKFCYISLNWIDCSLIQCLIDWCNTIIYVCKTGRTLIWWYRYCKKITHSRMVVMTVCCLYLNAWFENILNSSSAKNRMLFHDICSFSGLCDMHLSLFSAFLQCHLFAVMWLAT